MPTTVPKRDATTLLRVSKLTRVAITKWKPINGENETAAPMAKPDAML